MHNRYKAFSTGRKDTINVNPILGTLSITCIWKEISLHTTRKVTDYRTSTEVSNTSTRRIYIYIYGLGAGRILHVLI